MRYSHCPICGGGSIKDRKEKRIGTHRWRNYLKRGLRNEVRDSE